jgi:hypothetical protein
MIKIIATLCSLASPSSCHDQVVTTSDYADVTAKACQVGMPQLAAFMANFPQYSLARWRCEEGDVPKKERT